MFTFFGLFADPASGLSADIRRVLPSLHVIGIERPIRAIAARFGAEAYERERECIPEAVIRAVEILSAEYPGARFLLLRTECFGGSCINWGKVIQKVVSQLMV